MVRTEDVEEQLKRVGANFQFFARPELRELPHILFDNERIEHVVRGRYEGGWAILCATDQRVLLVDKKPFYLTIEDMRYDMIADVEFNHRMLDATIRLGTVNKTLRFTAYSHASLRLISSFIQQQVMLLRQRHPSVSATPVQHPQQQPQLQPAGQQFTPQFEDVATDKLIGQSALHGMATDSPINPYNAPLVIRRRVSRFY